MAGRSVKRSTRRNAASPAMFTGLLYDQDHTKLIPHHVNKYYYHVSKHSEQQAEGAKATECKTNLRIPMQKLDDLIQSIVIETLTSRSALLDCLNLNQQRAEQISALTAAAAKLADTLTTSNRSKRKAIYQQIGERVTIHPDRIEIVLKPEGLVEHLNITLNNELDNEAAHTIKKPMTLRRRGQEMKLVIGGIKQKDSNIDLPLINLIAKAHQLKTELESGEVTSIKEFADLYSLDHGDAKNLIPLSYLAPSIIEEILTGHQPADLTVLRMRQLARHLPYIWSAQRQLLGFAA